MRLVHMAMHMWRSVCHRTRRACTPSFADCAAPRPSPPPPHAGPASRQRLSDALSTHRMNDSLLKGTYNVRGPPDNIKLSCDLTPPWNAEHEIVEEFTFDDELRRKFLVRFMRIKICCDSCFLCCMPCKCCECMLVDVNAADLVYSNWLAVSTDSVYYLKRRHLTGGRCNNWCCPDMSQQIFKQIPVTNIQDITTLEPVGYATCCLKHVTNRTLIKTSVGVSDTTSLFALQDPQRFRKVVMDLKKGLYVRPDGTRIAVTGHPAVTPQTMSRCDTTIAASVAPMVAPARTKMERLAEVKAMLDSGLISQQDFDDSKAKILAE